MDVLLPLLWCFLLLVCARIPLSVDAALCLSAETSLHHIVHESRKLFKWDHVAAQKAKQNKPGPREVLPLSLPRKKEVDSLSYSLLAQEDETGCPLKANRAAQEEGEEKKGGQAWWAPGASQGRGSQRRRQDPCVGKGGVSSLSEAPDISEIATVRDHSLCSSESGPFCMFLNERAPPLETDGAVIHGRVQWTMRLS
uniref:Uncharacterized protein n=1 Tax=Chromera velia CCMP2878 TaxID=1169474 RepID=A0A0G4HC45_9ALVE|mmetsp:Transcript_32268/g.64046  ORF Transcript_32268/g.64046 Transcript_32268/m.64046 type:complete len:197 (+) Transcript_32268:274-864(+)|eukprot:Cvel_6211.t1-p1 / transcript=Cvel_6211.t1 / gene=Cvel_6211 / organism=Chromera_velia_CCMP2878 / gene_product=hypothetical protein / transcript_product=hypothetical protein / location=Cvel_scaffold300:93029-94544(-) / protein_length=196 / sequence_SO=supercontig / SO=protein_coding / is_pseudo=false